MGPARPPVTCAAGFPGREFWRLLSRRAWRCATGPRGCLVGSAPSFFNKVRRRRRAQPQQSWRGGCGSSRRRRFGLPFRLKPGKLRSLFLFFFFLFFYVEEPFSSQTFFMVFSADSAVSRRSNREMIELCKAPVSSVCTACSGLVTISCGTAGYIGGSAESALKTTNLRCLSLADLPVGTNGPIIMVTGREMLTRSPDRLTDLLWAGPTRRWAEHRDG